MNGTNEEYKEWLIQVFDDGSEQYGRVGPDFFSYFGNKLVEHAELVEGSTVLDVACGRGSSLLPAYFRVGPSGEVIGIDLSSEMVAETQKEVEVSDLHGIRVQLMDAEDLQFPAETFDSVLCGLALFFFPNVERALAEIHRVLKPGGFFTTTTFGQEDSRWEAFDELIIAYKDKFRPVPLVERASFDNAEEIIEALTKAGFNEIEIFSEDKEFYYAGPDEWWASMWSHGGRALLERMDEVTLQEFKVDCFKFIQENVTKKGIPQMVRVLITRANRPAESDQIRM